MEFKQAVVTQNGRTLMAKLLAGKQTVFTKVKISSTVYQDGQLENLTALTNIKQETSAQAYENNTATVSVVAAIENTGLQTGYYINTVGLYAMDPDKGEILYSVSSASVNGYMPPDTGVSKSGFEFKIYTEVGNASKVDLTVDPAAFATRNDIKNIEKQIFWQDVYLSVGETAFDLNTFVSQGQYYLKGITINNSPINGYLFLEVQEVSGGWSVMQKVNHDSSNITYSRVRKTDAKTGEQTWTDWVQQALITSNTASATKLQTARKINGISFDGSKDINLAPIDVFAPADFNTLITNGQFYIKDTKAINGPEGYSDYHHLTVINAGGGWRIKQILKNDSKQKTYERSRIMDASNNPVWTDWSKDLQTQINELKALITTN